MSSEDCAIAGVSEPATIGSETPRDGKRKASRRAEHEAANDRLVDHLVVPVGNRLIVGNGR